MGAFNVSLLVVISNNMLCIVTHILDISLILGL